MPSFTRRQFILGSVSAGAVARTLAARADERPANSLDFLGIAPTDRFIHDIVALADGSFALNLVGRDKTSSTLVVRHDADGKLLWRAELDESERVRTVRALVPASGDANPDLYVSSGFKKVWRLGENGRSKWEMNLFDYVGMHYPQAMAAHPAGGVIIGGIADNSADSTERCANCAIVRLGGDGASQWTWWRGDAWHGFATTIVVTSHGAVIAHMMSDNPTTGSAGDACMDRSLPQWTVWIDPDGRTMRTQPWPANRRAEAMTLDRAGRLVFFGQTLPELRYFFRICDAETGTVLYEHIFGEPEADVDRRDWYMPFPRPLDVSDRGVSVFLATGCRKSTAPWGTNVYTITPAGLLEIRFFGGDCGAYAYAMLPDGSAFLSGFMDELVRQPFS